MTELTEADMQFFADYNESRSKTAEVVNRLLNETNRSEESHKLLRKWVELCEEDTYFDPSTPESLEKYKNYLRRKLAMIEQIKELMRKEQK